MNTRKSKLQSAEDAAKQVKQLLNAVAQINGIKCPLSIKQIKMIIDGIGECQNKTIYVSKIWGTVKFEEPKDNNPSIGIRITRWFDEDEFIVGIF